MFAPVAAPRHLLAMVVLVQAAALRGLLYRSGDWFQSQATTGPGLPPRASRHTPGWVGGRLVFTTAETSLPRPFLLYAVCLSLSVCLSTYLSISLSVYLAIRLSISLYLSVYLYLSITQTIYLSMSIVFPFLITYNNL